MPFRDVFEVNAAKVKDREDRLVTLFLSGDETRFDQADRIMAESTRHNIGNVARTINIPTLAMMFLHPKVRDRFRFEADGDETIDGRVVRRVRLRETTKPNADEDHGRRRPRDLRTRIDSSPRPASWYTRS